MGNLTGKHRSESFKGQQHFVANVQNPPPFKQGLGWFSSPPPRQGNPNPRQVNDPPRKENPPQGYRSRNNPQGYRPGYPQGQIYSNPDSLQPESSRRISNRPRLPGTNLCYTACCGTFVAFLACLLCSCSPCIGAGRLRTEDEENMRETPVTANIAAPAEDTDYH